jgi:hypothetical protein
MGTILSFAAVAVLLVLIAVSLVRQRKMKAEKVLAHDRERAAPGLAADERLRARRARTAAGLAPPAQTGADAPVPPSATG